MGWWKSKTDLRWQEPKAVRQARVLLEMRGLPRWALPAAAAITSATLMIIWGVASVLAGNGPNDPVSFAEATVIATALSLFIAYIAPWIALWVPSDVLVRQEGIQLAQGNRHLRWKYSEIVACRITTRGHDTSQVTVLTLTIRSGKEELLGVAESITPEVLRQKLQERGLRVEDG
jgi:hypothetical protein